MNEVILEGAKPIESGHYRPSIKRLRLILMFFMCINLFGFPTAFGGWIETFCGFVPIAFFILSGYLVLRESEDRSKRIARTIRRTALVFLVLAVVYFGINWVYYQSLGVNILPVFLSKRFWFNFLVMNVWQFEIGGAIWYVQALLYAYILLYFFDKWKLLRFDWLIAAVLILLTVCTGELAGVFQWNVAGYTYLPGNFLTRALPYVLLGNFLHRKMAVLSAVRRLWYWCAILVGIVLIIVEITLLGKLGMSGYYGHLLGMPILAVSVCMLAFQDASPVSGFEAALGMSRWHINCIYYFCQPVSVGVVLLLSVLAPILGEELTASAVGFIGIATFLLCFGLAWLIAYISGLLFRRNARG